MFVSRRIWMLSLLMGLAVSSMGEACRWTLWGTHGSKVKHWDAQLFREQAAAWRPVVEGHRPAENKPVRPEDKVAVVADQLEGFFEKGLAIDLPPEKLSRLVRKKVKFRSGPLTSSEAREIACVLLDASRPHGGEGWKSFFDYRLDPIVAAHVDKNFLRSEKGQEVLEKLAALGLMNEPTGPELAKLKMERFSHWQPLVRSIFFNSLLIHFGLPPLDFPNIRPIEFAPYRGGMKEAMDRGDREEAWRIAQIELRRWAQVQAGYRSARAIYFGTLAAVAAYFVVKHSALIQTAAASLFLTQEELRAYEHETYDPKAVVEEQLREWQEALGHSPTTEELSSKRREIEAQERDGVLRIFGTKP